ncbi:hypothetical protein GCM10010172_03650 [Paractinoplanes ferrugineus]|uniref:Uncharacterized protein n=1 Tax=Paractinoplanes ferrugineus TaxID=113564 RepID=A0A919MIK2_9ACTN|nr:hypothetical protein [Actinoplanes ferrugineus]GIE13770.1 hypothetical protein Afe05nite_56100 [Actinoplanes ferrugineus]
MSLTARTGAVVAVACLSVHAALLIVAGPAAAPMLALSIVCAVCARGRASRPEHAAMVALSGLMLAMHLGGHHHGGAALMRAGLALAGTQVVLGVLSLRSGGRSGLVDSGLRPVHDRHLDGTTYVPLPGRTP